MRGRHYTTYVDQVRELKRAGRFDELDTLLLELVDATEAEHRAEDWGVAPRYYEELAKLYRKLKMPDKELAILRRFADQGHAPGATTPKLLERLESLEAKSRGEASPRKRRASPASPSVESGITPYRLSETPVAIVDFETTGLVPGSDRVVEVAIVRLDPGEPPRLVLDTLVNPLRPMSATEIHGVTENDVRQAPTFRDIGGDVVDALSGAAVAAYNVYFDIKFLASELNQLGVSHTPPHFCLMHMRPMLGLGSRCKLADACRTHDITLQSSHVASSDAMASGDLLRYYLSELSNRNVSTFGDLARLRR